MSEVFEALVKEYEKEGYRMSIGLNPWHFKNYRDAPFACFYRNKKKISSGGGISLQEVYFFESLFDGYNPKNIFLIGSAFGWSSLLISMLNRGSRAIAIDKGGEGKDNELGISLTNKIARKNNLNLNVVKGESPKDVKHVLHKEGIKKIDFVFVDGLHTNKQQFRDFRGVLPFSKNDTVFVFHDVINWNMEKSFQRIGKEMIGFESKILWRTPSGMGIVYPKNFKKEQTIHSFCEPRENIAEVKRSAFFFKVWQLIRLFK